MYTELEEKRNEKNLNSIGFYIAINENGNLLMFPSGKGRDIQVYIENNINNMTLNEFSSYSLKLMDMSLMKENIDFEEETIDKFHDFEKSEYKKDKCKSMKLIKIELHKTYPNKLIIVDMVNVSKYEWGGGRYMHFLPITSSNEEVFDYIKKVYSYKGHMPGATQEEKKEYRVM